MEMKYMNNDKQHREDTKYKQWQDGMYVMLDDLDCDYELAVVENSLLDSVYFLSAECFIVRCPGAQCFGILYDLAGTWVSMNVVNATTKIPRAQALYIATGDADI
jgi:hypothetical protein